MRVRTRKEGEKTEGFSGELLAQLGFESLKLLPSLRDLMDSVSLNPYSVFLFLCCCMFVLSSPVTGSALVLGFCSS